MPRAVPVVVLGLVILGCSKRPPTSVAPPTGVERPADAEASEPAPTPPPIELSPTELPPEIPAEEPPAQEETPRPGGTIRVLDAPRSTPPGLLDALGVPPRIFSEPDLWRVDGRCWHVPIAGDARASNVVSAWTEALADGPGPLHWILALESARERVLRGERLLDRPDVRADTGGVRVCAPSPVTDLAARLEHPALRRAIAGRSAVDTRSAFLRRQGGRYIANNALGENAPHVDRVDTIDGGAPALLFKLGDVDVALVQGHDVRALEPLGERVALSRAPAREPTYFLWLNPQNRWLSSGEFREWLAGVSGRSEIVRLLFDGRGSRAYTLREDSGATPRYAIRPDPPPLPATSQPKLTLRFDDADPSAALLAARLRAELSPENVDLQIEKTAAPELLDRLARGGVEIALLRHRPETADPILALLGTVWWLGEPAQNELVELLDAAGIEDPQARADAAIRIENALLADARVVPLVRLETWLATREGLVGVRIDPDGTLRLDTAWWRR